MAFGQNPGYRSSVNQSTSDRHAASSENFPQDFTSLPAPHILQTEEQEATQDENLISLMDVGDIAISDTQVSTVSEMPGVPLQVTTVMSKCHPPLASTMQPYVSRSVCHPSLPKQVLAPVCSNLVMDVVYTGDNMLSTNSVSTQSWTSSSGEINSEDDNEMIIASRYLTISSIGACSPDLSAFAQVPCSISSPLQKEGNSVAIHSNPEPNGYLAENGAPISITEESVDDCDSDDISDNQWQTENYTSGMSRYVINPTSSIVMNPTESIITEVFPSSVQRDPPNELHLRNDEASHLPNSYVRTSM